LSVRELRGEEKEIEEKAKCEIKQPWAGASKAQPRASEGGHGRRHDHGEVRDDRGREESSGNTGAPRSSALPPLQRTRGAAGRGLVAAPCGRATRHNATRRNATRRAAHGRARPGQAARGHATHSRWRSMSASVTPAATQRAIMK
jgi:hypothetical protein